MSRILGFSTSGPYCGAALLVDGNVISARHEEMTKGQAERLMPMLAEVLDEADLSYRDLDAIGVGIGPGNFTGIRISVAAARGLALGLNIPAVGVQLLEALALGHDGPVLALINAGRDRLYTQRFGHDAERGPALVDIEEIDDWAMPGLTCIGNREEEIAARINASYGPARFYPASAIARIAAQRWRDAPEPPAPLYLRPADAAPARDTAPVMLD